MLNSQKCLKLKERISSKSLRINICEFVARSDGRGNKKFLQDEWTPMLTKLTTNLNCFKKNCIATDAGSKFLKINNLVEN